MQMPNLENIKRLLREYTKYDYGPQTDFFGEVRTVESKADLLMKTTTRRNESYGTKFPILYSQQMKNPSLMDELAYKLEGELNKNNSVNSVDIQVQSNSSYNFTELIVYIHHLPTFTRRPLHSDDSLHNSQRSPTFTRRPLHSTESQMSMMESLEELHHRISRLESALP
jgi:hypothetical protein